MKKKIYERLNSMIDSKEIGALGTVVRGSSDICPTGSKFLVDETGHNLVKEIKEPIFAMLKDFLPEIIKDKKPKVIQVVFDGVPYEIFIDPIYPQERLIIFGGGHIALPLVSIAKLLDYQVTVIDDRPSFASPDRFPQADNVLCQDFTKAIREASFDRNTYIIIITRGHQHDKTCLEESLKQPQPAYIGMIGSKRKVYSLFQELRLSGCDEDRLDRVYAPIGLDIGAQTPEEIALSIMAEVVMVNHYGFSRGLKMKQEEEKVGC
ncbi:MAG: xanthine dehydrogenase [Gracilibacter sp. BRH_c7a]|nr:MAG: xanthine dehydrogenase [Gracilibacter sp. BRH_c7a]